MTMLKSSIRVITLILCGIIGLWAVGHGIALVTMMRAATHEDLLQNLVEVGISIAGGVCVLSVAVEQLICWRTHHRDGGLI